MQSRREFLVYLGVGSYGLLKDLQAHAALFPLPRPRVSNGRFKPISPTSEDALVLPRGFKYDVIASFGDPLGTKGPFGAETFGNDCDFIGYFPIDSLSGGKNNRDGLLWVNHEFVSPLYTRSQRPKSKERIQEEKLMVGGSIIRVDSKSGAWKRVDDAKYTRRFTALYPEIEMTGPAKSKIKKGKGTLANCSGGHTPWHTALTAEENFHNANPSEEDGLAWSTWGDTKINEDEYGWMVEVDPFGELAPKKHTSLGRFAHENAALTQGKTGKLVVYMGDDAKDQYFYKYVSRETRNDKAPRKEQQNLLTEGVLYVANFQTNKWMPLDIELSPALKEAGFSSQADVLLKTRQAAAALKATPLDRPEDCEVHPLDGSVYIALTNNNSHGNYFGQVVRLVERGDDAEALEFKYEIFLAGGPQSGLACPDNLCFDRKGNLWVVCDISGVALGKPPYDSFANNGLFYVPTSGKAAGQADQFASGPNDSELTGPCLSPKEDTLFLSVQHPGDESSSAEKLTSHWPGGGSLPPKSSVVAIRGL